MLRKTQRARTGFTLIEIMIVVAVIALLSVMAIPSLMRARKRTQATAILKEAQMLSDAAEMYYTEHPGVTTLTYWANYQPYIAKSSRLYSAFVTPNGVLDPYGNNYGGYWDGGPRVAVSPVTKNLLSDVIDDASSFWGPYSY